MSEVTWPRALTAVVWAVPAVAGMAPVATLAAGVPGMTVVVVVGPLVQTLVRWARSSYWSGGGMAFWLVAVRVRPRAGSRVRDVTWVGVTVPGDPAYVVGGAVSVMPVVWPSALSV